MSQQKAVKLSIALPNPPTSTISQAYVKKLAIGAILSVTASIFHTYVFSARGSGTWVVGPPKGIAKRPLLRLTIIRARPKQIVLRTAI